MESQVSPLTEQLCSASWNGDIDSVKKIISSISASAFQGYNARGQTALYCAARNNHQQIVGLLLTHKGNLQIQASFLIAIVRFVFFERHYFL